MFNYLCSSVCVGGNTRAKRNARNASSTLDNPTYDSDDSSTDYEFLEIKQGTGDGLTTPVRMSYGIQKSPFADLRTTDEYHGSDDSSSSDVSSEALIPAPPSPKRASDSAAEQASKSRKSDSIHQINYAFARGDFSQINRALESGRWDALTSGHDKQHNEDDEDSHISDISMQSAMHSDVELRQDLSALSGSANIIRNNMEDKQEQKPPQPKQKDVSQGQNTSSNGVVAATATMRLESSSLESLSQPSGSLSLLGASSTVKMTNAVSWPAALIWTSNAGVSLWRKDEEIPCTGLLICNDKSLVGGFLDSAGYSISNGSFYFVCWELIFFYNTVIYSGRMDGSSKKTMENI